MERRGESGPYVTFLYYFAKVFGLAPFSFKDNRVSHGSFSDKLWTMIALLILGVLQSTVILDRLNADDGIGSKLTQASDVFSFEVELITIVILVIAVWYKEDQIVEIVKSFTMIDDIFKSLEIRDDYATKFKRQAIFSALLSCVVMLLSIQLDLVFMYAANFPITPLFIIAMIGGSISSCSYHFAVYTFVSIIVITKERYEKLNYILGNVLPVQQMKPTNLRGVPRPFDSQLQSSNIAYVNEPMHFHHETLFNDESKPVQKLIKIQELHGQLHDVVEKIMDLFSCPIVAVISFYFTTITTNCFYSYASLRSRLDHLRIFEFLTSTIWMALFAVELCVIAVVCASAQNTAKFTPTVLRKIWIKHHPIKMIDEIQMLSLQLLQRPLTISAFGFFSLDYSYLYKIFCAVVAYFVIMVQLDGSKVDAARNISTLAPNITGMH